MNSLAEWPEWRWAEDSVAWRMERSDGEPLLSWQKQPPLLPVTGKGRLRVGAIRHERAGETAGRIIAAIEGSGELFEIRLEWTRHPNHLEWRASFVAASDGTLHAWEIVPPEAVLGLYHLLHIRNRHFTPRVVERYMLGGMLSGGEMGEGGRLRGFRAATDSRDWQFAPNPSYFVFEKNGVHLFFGAKDVPQGFGLTLEVEKYRVKEWRFDCGRGTFRFRQGETVESPTFCLFLREEGDYWDAVDQWVDILIAEQRIPDPARRTFPEAMLKPLLAPWIDQCYLSRSEGEGGMVWNWSNDEPKRLVQPEEVCTEKFIRTEVERAKAYGLPFGSIGIDDRWFDWRGDYELRRDRFPDMRGLVDWLHTQGLKVILWFPPFDVEPQAAMNQRTDWLAGGGAKTRCGQSFLDYSIPEVREQWLLPKLRLWMGNGPGCWNADGLKLDFMADKIPDDIPVHDRSWHGEERFSWQWHRFVYRAMKEIKPDSILLGCAPHPHFAPFQDWVRTFDVHDSDHRQHATRGLRIRHLAPGTILSYDFHAFRERLEDYLKQAVADRAHIEIGSLFGLDTAMGEAELELLRRYLPQLRPKPGIRTSPCAEGQFRQWSFF